MAQKPSYWNHLAGWLINRDPYNNLSSLYNWPRFHPLDSLTNQGLKFMEKLVRRFGSHQHMVDVLLIHIRPRINQRNFVSSGNENSSPIILQEPIIQENLYSQNGPISQTCWAQRGHLGPRNAKYWSPLISAKRISILITCDSEMPKKKTDWKDDVLCPAKSTSSYVLASFGHFFEDISTSPQNKLSMSHIHQLYWISQEFVKKIDEMMGRILLIDDGAENFMHLLIW